MNKDQFAITRDGISQAERWLDTLVPSYLQIDSREIPDFVAFLYELSKTVKYYNERDQVAGNWEDFFTSDTNLIIILLSKLDISEVDQKYTLKKQNIISSKTIEDAESKLREYMIFIFELYSKMNVALNQFKNSSDTSETETMIYLLSGIEEIGKTLFSYYSYSLQIFPGTRSKQMDEALASYKGTLHPNISYFNYDQKNSLQVLTASIIHLNNAFEQLISKLARVVRLAKEFAKENKFMDKQYQPQVGLFLTFLDLYKYVKKRLNGLVEKHLDFYYQDVLGINHGGRSPDSVHIAAELDDQASNVFIGPNNLLLAENGGNQILFKPEAAQVLSNAKIKSLRTIFLSNYKQIESTSSEFKDVREIQLFKAEHPLFLPDEYIKKPEGSRPWAVMGEDQHDFPKGEQTMIPSNPGIAIVSSLFFQVEGKRIYSLTMELKSSESPSLNEYIINYVNVRKNVSRETVEYKLFSNIFNLWFTSKDGWEEIENYNIKILDADKPIFKLNISFTLENDNKPFDCYDEGIHQEKIDTELPILKLLLNPNVEHYGYSFLHSIQLNRITINVRVQGSRAVKLQNNVGPLSTSGPFQPFGPQPSIGSFLDIKNTNVFNRYLKDFSIRINWLELPRGKGGFGSYYNGYGIKLENDTFKINLSSLSGGTYLPASPIRQQFSLFKGDPQTKELIEENVIRGIDFKKITFQNEPKLRDEVRINEQYFKEGAIRIELCAPDEAFGHRLFTQVFPDVILNNSKKFRKKLPVPNQPYIPIIKAIELDYELEYSEGFKEEHVRDQNFQLFHIFPFGIQKIFPQGDKRNYSILPNFNYSSNLFIGLENVAPSSELPLFFQMEERSFHHTLHEPQPIVWSYLDANNWIEFNPRNLKSNTTNNFVSSGIVSLKMPSEIDENNTILPAGLFWIRASSRENHHASGRIKSIIVNGILAHRVLDKNNENQFKMLESNEIIGFEKNVKGIKNIFQLYPSFGGNTAESDDNYYVRVSERLRHKNRFVQIRDIAQAILQEFPQILITKLFNSKREKFSITPGVDIHIVLIPRELEGGKFSSENPKVSLPELYKVKTFVSSIISPFVKIEVGNAIYERVKVIGKVMFHEDSDTDLNSLRFRLISDINKFIAPWLFGENSNLVIGSKIYKAEFLIFIKNLAYVKYISGFSLVHFSNETNSNNEDFTNNIEDTATSNIDFIVGSTPASVLIPSPFHIIEVLSEMAPNMPKSSGIGNFIVGEEFLVATNSREKVNGNTLTDDDESFDIIISNNIG
jgi:hypothetical protein